MSAPVFAYFYQWFNANSWTLANKLDHPLIGNYDSSDVAVMKAQIQEAKANGITGWIVGWPNNLTQNARLASLITVSEQEGFRLVLAYQGRTGGNDFHRQVRTVADIQAGFALFIKDFASSPAWWHVDGKPLTIMTDTFSYSHADLVAALSPSKSKLKILGFDNTVALINQNADILDGNAYYWSSVNPYSDPGYGSKLNQMAAAVHAHGHYWIAPAAPGFNDLAIGGKTDVPRNNGHTLNIEYWTAIKAVPDMVGLISWNEYVENTYIEPSVNFGNKYLAQVKAMHGGS